MTASSLPETAPAAPPRRSRRRRVALAVVVIFAALIVTAWLAREPLLRAAAAAWIVDDEPVPADAAVVLGGGLEYRPFAAADYYRRGLVRKILISNVRSSRAEQLGVLSSHVAANRNVLLRLGVPEDAIELFGEGLSNSYEEANALSDWAKRNGARSLLVPTEIFGSRRLRWTLRRAFKDGIAVRVPALDPLDYGRNDWWKHESGVIVFQNEVIKYLYYRMTY
jgi:uncharacterized SAM-binding protein YcdF (DUF218 family)